MVLVAHQGANGAKFVHHANGVAVGDVDFAIGSNCNPCKRKNHNYYKRQETMVTDLYSLDADPAQYISISWPCKIVSDFVSF